MPNVELADIQLQVKETVGYPGQDSRTVQVRIRAGQEDILAGTEDLWAAPGLIDMHTHVFAGGAAIGSPADTVGIESGVSAVVDAGSSGWQNFDKFLAEVVHPSKTRVFALLNISPDGLVNEKGELADLSRLSIDKTVECARRHSRYIKGIKARASATATGTTGIAGIEMAKEAAVKAKIPLMVHIGNGPPAFDDVLNLLEKGDIVTHCFHGKPGGLFLEDGSLRPGVRAARERGVKFDVGHGSASFNFAVARRAIEAGFMPDTISTDIYERNIHGPVFNLITTVNKLICLGMSKPDALLSCSAIPAQVLSISDQEPGLNLTLLEWYDKPQEYTDSDGNRLSLQGGFTIRYALVNGILNKL